MAAAQYPGQVSVKKSSSNPRAVAVFEFIGDASKPEASRLVPVSYFYAGEYEDAGIYLAQPAPVALMSGTEYEVEHAGLPAANYDVETAGRIGDAWIGYGDFKALNAGGSGTHAVSGDDVRPRLTKNAAAAAEAAKPAAEKSKASPDETATATKASPLDDHDRPTLKRKATPVGEQQKIPDETPVISPMDDPDRPHLGHTEPAKEKPGAKHLVGTPADMKQMVAVSDATTKEPHPFAYTWSNKEDETRAEQKLILAVQAALAPSPVRKAPQRTPRRAVPVSHIVKTAPSLELANVHISSFALTYENTPVMVLTARTSEATPRDVTVIAEVDIYNEPRILLSSVSDAAHRADRPEMHLIDAVDADGSNRASLLFELRGATDRKFALYRVSRGTATRTFLSGTVPYQPPIPAAAP